MGTGVILSRKVTYARDPSFSKPEFIPSPLSPSLSKLYGSSFQKSTKERERERQGEGFWRRRERLWYFGGGCSIVMELKGRQSWVPWASSLSGPEEK